MSELKPCPFCGKMPEVADDGVCRCNNKSCSMAPYWYLPKYWNIRPIEDDLRKRIAELEALVNVSEGLYERIYEQAARIAELEEAQRWIPVGDRPLVDGRFIVLLKNGDIRRDFTFLDGGRYYWWYSGDQVTHYMPLPEPPKEREE